MGIRSEKFDTMTVQPSDDDLQNEREARQIGGRNDLYMAAQSGFGGSGSGCEQGVPTEFALLATLAAFGVSFGILYKASTTNMARRKKRDNDLDFAYMFQDVMWKGLEDFENKI